MKKIVLILMAVNLTVIANSQSILDKAKKTFSKSNSNVTEEEAGFGVKEALNNGINSAEHLQTRSTLLSALPCIGSYR